MDEEENYQVIDINNYLSLRNYKLAKSDIKYCILGIYKL